MQRIIENLLTKEVTRKEFLGIALSGFLSIIGVASMINKLRADDTVHDSQNYSSSPYGGYPKTTT